MVKNQENIDKIFTYPLVILMVFNLANKRNSAKKNDGLKKLFNRGKSRKKMFI